MWKDFRRGILQGIPIFLGYLSVSFGIGILAIQAGMTVAESVLLSAANLTSAGQAAGIEVIAAGGTLIEIILTQLVINLRYALMSLSLSQKLAPETGTGKRLAISYGITDEIFAVSYGQPRVVTPSFMAGLIMISALGWVLGTALGAVAGALLPASVTSALGIMLYGMFIAIFLPAAKRDRRVLCVVAIAIGISLLMRYVFDFISSGFAVILCALIASVIGALLFPISEEET